MSERVTTISIPGGVSFKALPYHVLGAEHEAARVRLRKAVRCFGRAMRRHGKRMRADKQSYGGRYADHIGELSDLRTKAPVDASVVAQWCRDWGAQWKRSYPTIWFIWNRVAEACEKLVEPQRLFKEADAKAAEEFRGSWDIVTFKFGTLKPVNP